MRLVSALALMLALSIASAECPPQPCPPPDPGVGLNALSAFIADAPPGPVSFSAILLDLVNGTPVTKQNAWAFARVAEKYKAGEFSVQLTVAGIPIVVPIPVPVVMLTPAAAGRGYVACVSPSPLDGFKVDDQLLVRFTMNASGISLDGDGNRFFAVIVDQAMLSPWSVAAALSDAAYSAFMAAWGNLLPW